MRMQQTPERERTSRRCAKEGTDAEPCQRGVSALFFAVMRVVHLSARAADPDRRAILRAVAATGVDLVAAVPERWLDDAGDERRTGAGSDGGVRIVPVAVSSIEDEVGATWHAGTVRQLLRDVRPDLVHGEREPWSPVAATVLAAAKGLRIPVVLQAASPIAVPLSLVARWRRRRVLRQLAGAIGTSTAALALLRDELPEGRPVACIADRATIVPPRLPTVAHDTFTIGFHGRLVPERGCDLLLRAVVKLYGPWQLRIAGTGPSQEELETLAQRLGIAARVEWLGGLPSDRRDAFWSSLDVLVAPSRTTPDWVEPAGLLLRDAMARGIAVAGTRSGALPDVIGDAGALVAEEDPAALAEVLQGLAEDAEGLAAVREAGRKRVMGRFTAEAVAEGLLEMWKSVSTTRVETT